MMEEDCRDEIKSSDYLNLCINPAICKLLYCVDITPARLLKRLRNTASSGFNIVISTHFCKKATKPQLSTIDKIPSHSKLF